MSTTNKEQARIAAEFDALERRHKRMDTVEKTMTRKHTPYTDLLHTWTATGESFDSYDDILDAKQEGYLRAMADYDPLLEAARAALIILEAARAALIILEGEFRYTGLAQGHVHAWWHDIAERCDYINSRLRAALAAAEGRST